MDPPWSKQAFGRTPCGRSSGRTRLSSTRPFLFAGTSPVYLSTLPWVALPRDRSLAGIPTRPHGKMMMEGGQAARPRDRSRPSSKEGRTRRGL